MPCSSLMAKQIMDTTLEYHSDLFRKEYDVDKRRPHADIGGQEIVPGVRLEMIKVKGIEITKKRITTAISQGKELLPHL